MKKFIIVCTILFIANLGCKKMDIDGGGLCACSPVTGPQLYLVIKNTTHEDLLNNKTAGAYSKDKIELYRKDEEGKTIPVSFGIRPPFSYGDEQFNFNQLHADLTFLQRSPINTLYLKLGDGKLYELNLELGEGKYNLLIDNKEAEKATGNVAKYVPIFYLTEGK